MSAETETPDAAAPTATTTSPPKPCKQLEDGVNHLMQGKRHLLVKDYPSAVASLADACSLLAGKYGDLAPECGEPYLCYGKALLELARAEAGVIEMAPSKSDSDDEEEEDDKDSKEDEDDKDSKEDEDDKDSKEDEDDKDSKEDEEDKESKESEASKSGGEESPKDGEEVAKEAVKVAKEAVKVAKEEEEDQAKNGDEEKNGEAVEDPGKSNGAGPSKSTDDGDEDEDDKDEDGEVNNLQLAWEILEMAKIIYQKQVDAATNSKDVKMRLSEVLLKLGEVGIESENWPTAVDDLKECLALQKEVLEADDRRLAETFYHLAVAYSNNNEYQESIDAYEKACNQLQVRIDVLEAKRPKEDIINQGLIDSEVKELKELLVEMKERLNDTKTEKDEPAPKEDQDDIVRNGSESKPVSNITHLVRKKPKADESDSVESKADNVDKTEGESNAEERKRKSEEVEVPDAAALKKAKMES